MKLQTVQGTYAIMSFSLSKELPRDIFSGEGFVSVTRSGDEISVVCESSIAAKYEPSALETGFRALKVEGPLPFSLTGVLSSLSDPLARAEISIFAISTFDTDYILIREAAWNRALAVLSGAGFTLLPGLRQGADRS